jgi:hypothetical protein
VCRDYRAVRVRDENEYTLAVVFDDSLDFTDYSILLKCYVGYTRAHGHNFKADYSDLFIIYTKLLGLQVVQKISVWVEPNANPVYE